ncbi:MAG: hypothetical protein KJ067_09070 [Vicinamibacteria bacterium]|nr:hypothetical protein [Vicinamibacteria bacterium]
MTEPLVCDETPVEFFREQLEKAMDHQRVSTSAFTEYYLVNLLTRAIGRSMVAGDGGADETPLALLYVEAVRSARAERARLLQSLGDQALFLSGFFADSLARRLVDLDYCRALGGFAYARLSREAAGSVAPVFEELAARFVEFSDLLQEVSETTRLTSVQSVVRLYERWQQTGSKRAALLLQAQGIAPMAPAREARPS